MLKIHYQGPIVDQYVDGNFYTLMWHLGASVVLNSTFPHPQNPSLIGYVVNAWNLDEVRVLYHSSYKLTESGLEGEIATVVLDGSEKNIGEVERKIEEGVSNRLHLREIPGLFEIKIQRPLLQIQRR